MTARYALYYAPRRGEALAAAARQWLGRDPESGQPSDLTEVPGMGAERLAEVVAAPRYYGFHATLKPPMALAEGVSEADLLDASARFVAARQPFSTPPLDLASVGGFLALITRTPSAELHALADDCVAAFDAFRRPSPAAELDQRRAVGLSPRQEALLCRWGYPYVLEEWRFHLTLTGRIVEPDERAILTGELARRFAPFIGQPIEVRDLCLFRQPTRHLPFTMRARFALGGGRRLSTQAWSGF